MPRASFFARVHLFNCRSRLNAAARVACGSEYTSATGRRLAVDTQALPSLEAAIEIGGFADAESVVGAAEDVHEVHNDDGAIVCGR